MFTFFLINISPSLHAQVTSRDISFIVNGTKEAKDCS